MEIGTAHSGLYLGEISWKFEALSVWRTDILAGV